MTDSVPRVRFIVRLPQAYCAAGSEAMLEVAAKAEELFLYGVSVQDHLVADSSVSPCGESHTSKGDDRDVFEALQTLAFVAARTERVRLVTGVLVLPLRHPVWLAKEVASLDLFSSGRVILGVGVGASPGRRTDDRSGQDLSAHARIARTEYESIGKRRVHRGHLADEAIEVMQRLWSEDSASFQGEHFEIDGVSMFPKPAQVGGPPFWMGGRSEAARRRAVRYGEGWFPSQISVELYRDGVRSLHEIAASEGRQPPSVLGVNTFTILSDDDEVARNRAERAFGERFSPSALSGVMLAGNPETIARQIQAFVDVGVNTFDLKLLPPAAEDVMAAMEMLATEVVPAVEVGRRIGPEV